VSGTGVSRFYDFGGVPVVTVSETRPGAGHTAFTPKTRLFAAAGNLLRVALSQVFWVTSKRRETRMCGRALFIACYFRVRRGLIQRCGGNPANISTTGKGNPTRPGYWYPFMVLDSWGRGIG
jgi:hypothetical protein